MMQAAECFHFMGMFVERVFRRFGGIFFRRGLRRSGFISYQRYFSLGCNEFLRTLLMRRWFRIYRHLRFPIEVGFIQSRADKAGNHHSEVGRFFAESFFMTRSNPQHTVDAVGHEGRSHQPFVPGGPE